MWASAGEIMEGFLIEVMSVLAEEIIQAKGENVWLRAQAENILSKTRRGKNFMPSGTTIIEGACS